MNWGITDFDPVSGLPAVPRGYFWRVVAPQGISECYKVELRQTVTTMEGRFRKHPFTSNRLVGSHPILREKISEKTILDAACYAFVHDRDIKRHFGREAPIRTDLLGDYPPKSVLTSSSSSPTDA